MDGERMAFEDDFPQCLAKLRAAGVSAGDDILTLLPQPLAEQLHLCRFADPIDSVNTEEHGHLSVSNGRRVAPQV